LLVLTELASFLTAAAKRLADDVSKWSCRLLKKAMPRYSIALAQFV